MPRPNVFFQTNTFFLYAFLHCLSQMIAFESIMCVLYSTAARIVLLYLVYLSIHIHLQGYARECTLLYRQSASISRP